MVLVDKDRLSQIKESVEHGTATPEMVRFYHEQLKAYDTDLKEVLKALKDAKEIAKDFDYPVEVITALENAKSCSEINRIMKDAKRYI